MHQVAGFDFDEVATDGVLAAEVYTLATVPVQFRSSEGKRGVVVLWLK